MPWSDLKISNLNEIPDRYLVSWKFFNAFFKAYQERADFIEGADRAETYDDIMLTGAQVSATVLRARLGNFHGKVLSCFNDTIWYKSSTWSSLSFFSKGEATDKRKLGLGVIELEEWDEEALKTFLTEDIYDLIFTGYSFATAFDPAYWSGLYKLLSVMKYRKLTIHTGYEPTIPTEPYLLINGVRAGSSIKKEDGEEGNADALFTAAVSGANSNATNSDAGSLTLATSSVSSQSRSVAGKAQGNEFTNVQNVAIAGFGKVTSDPFCVVPAQMNIQTLLYRENSRTVERIDEITIDAITEVGGKLSWSYNRTVSKSDPINATITVEGSYANEVVLPPKTLSATYDPSLQEFQKKGAENPKFGVSFAGDRCKVGIGSLVNVVNTNSFSNLQSPMQEHPINNSSLVNSSEITAVESISYKLNLAMCELPQDEFDYPAQ